MKFQNILLVLTILFLAACSKVDPVGTPTPTQTPIPIQIPTPVETVTPTPVVCKTGNIEDLVGTYDVDTVFDDGYAFSFTFRNQEECIKIDHIYPFKYWDWDISQYPKEYSLNSQQDWGGLERVEGKLQIVDGNIEPIYIMHSNSGWLDEGIVVEAAIKFNSSSSIFFNDFELDIGAGAYYLASNLCSYDIIDVDYKTFCSQVSLGGERYLNPIGKYAFGDWEFSFQSEILDELECGGIFDGRYELVGATNFQGENDTGYLNPIYLEFESIEDNSFNWEIAPANSFLSKNGYGLKIPANMECGSPNPPERSCFNCG